MSLQHGVVLRDEGNQVIVDIEGREVACVVRKTLRHKAGKLKKVVAVGDRVTVEAGDEGAAVVEVAPRRSAISRPDPGQHRREQVLVANLDAFLVVASARQPDIVPGLIDRFLVAGESRELDGAIVINKIDLDTTREYAPLAAVYRDLGYPVLETSAKTGEGIDAVRGLLADRTTTLLGHSGVGKSALANALDSSLRLRTGDVHEGTGKGTHTTTTTRLLRLPWGGYLVDTPGIREFGLWDVSRADLGHWFREIVARLNQCRFNDCRHRNEPGCAVKAAVEAGEIADWRYESYLRMFESLRK